MTKTLQFYRIVCSTLARHTNQELNFKETLLQIEESYVWVFGRHRSIDVIATMFDDFTKNLIKR